MDGNQNHDTEDKKGRFPLESRMDHPEETVIQVGNEKSAGGRTSCETTRGGVPMKRIAVPVSQPYEVLVGSGLLERVGELSAPLLSGRRAVLVSDSNVWPLYGQQVTDSLQKADFRVERFIFEAGEKSKTPQTLLDLLNHMAEWELGRADSVFALGGGVTGDLAGLAAALYQRGISCVQLPTSLLAMVDSSVGGKTAVDLPKGKNLVGTFTQPRLVLCDPDALATLPARVEAEGWAEVIKYGMLGSRELLDELAAGREDVDVEDVICRCITMKRDLVTQDERDTGPRQLLNFGHTIGHAVERCAGYGIYHGEGVAMGMAIMTRACVRQGLCTPQCRTVLEDLLERYHLPKTCPIGVERLLEAARMDKKRRGDAITLVQPSQPGRCILRKADYRDLAQILEEGIPL